MFQLSISCETAEQLNAEVLLSIGISVGRGPGLGGSAAADVELAACQQTRIMHLSLPK